MIYVVMYEYYDDWELVGAATDKEVAKQMKRDYCGTDKRTLSRTHIFDCEDGKPLPDLILGTRFRKNR